MSSFKADAADVSITRGSSVHSDVPAGLVGIARNDTNATAVTESTDTALDVDRTTVESRTSTCGDVDGASATANSA